MNGGRRAAAKSSPSAASMRETRARLSIAAHTPSRCAARFLAHPDIEAAARALAAQIESFEYNRKK